MTSTDIVTPQSRLLAAQGLITALKPAIQDNYVARISGRTYIMVAGAQALASAMGYTVKIVSCKHHNGDDGHWEAVASVIDTSTGQIIGEGFGHVFDNERPWCDRPMFARAAMCQTRATGRALKGCIGWMFALVGAEGSFLEEMPSETVAQAPALPPAQTEAKTIQFDAAPVTQESFKPAPEAPKKYDNLPDAGSAVFTPISAEVAKSGSGKYGAWELVVVKTVEGSQFATLNKRVAQACKELCEGGEQRCLITWKRTPKGGLDITAIEPASEEKHLVDVLDTNPPF